MSNIAEKSLISICHVATYENIAISLSWLRYFPQQLTSPIMQHGPLVRNVKLRVGHAPGMPGTFSPPPRVSDPDVLRGMSVTHVPWCMPGSLTNGFLWSRWRGKRPRHSRRMRDPQFYVFGKRPMQRQPISFLPWPAIWCYFEYF